MIFSLISFLLYLVHPIHISVTEIAFDEKENELEIVSRIFTDDLELAIRKQRKHDDLDILNPGRSVTTNDLVREYVLQHLQISLDDKKQTLHYLGFEQEGDALVCYIQVKSVKKWKKITVTNTVIHELFDDQSNLVHITSGNIVRSMRLLKNNSTESITFNP